MEEVAVAVKLYRDENEEHGTVQLKLRASLQVSEAGKLFTHFDKILAMERSEV